MTVIEDPTVFSFKGTNVQTITINNAPWFVAKEIAAILGYENSRTMTRRLDDDEKGVQKLHTPGGEQEMTIINESGLYSAILGSTKPDAKAFKRWVTCEVLPSIRKTGTYSCDPVVRKFVEEVRKKAYSQAVNDLAAAVHAAVTSLQGAGYSLDCTILQSFNLVRDKDNPAFPALLQQRQDKIIRQIVDPRFIATVRAEIERN